MDEDICRWVIEFLLRSSMDDDLLKRVLAVIPFPNSDFRLKKTALLRAIESERSNAVVTERLLGIFEMIEELDKNEGLAMMESMRAAYCAVAGECTVKYLAAGAKNGRYFDAVRRIWRGRVTEMERSGKSDLVSSELKRWKDDVEAAIWDKNVLKKLVNMNTRNEALKLIGDYLGEAWGVLGPSFIELSASLMGKRVMNEMQSVQLEKTIGKVAIVSEDVGGRIELTSQMENHSRSERQGSEAVLSQADAMRNDLLNTNQDAIGEVAIVSEDVGGNGGDRIELTSQTENHLRPEHKGSVPVVQSESTRNDLLNMNQDSGVGEGSKQSGFVAMNSERAQELATETVERQESDEIEKEVVVMHDPSSSRRENLKTSVLPRCKSLASHKRVRGGAKISHLDDLEDDSLSGKHTCLRTPEVERAREALKTSSLELQGLVKDPLPDALRIAESVALDLAEKNKTREHSAEDQNDAGAANLAINKDAVPIQPVNTDLRNPCHGHHTTVPRPGIMERNSTACTYEWNDSIDNLPEERHVSRLHLHSPKRKAISPLKKYAETKIVRRRARKRWSLLEEDTLRTAVQKFGKGNWKLILNSYRDIFDERTEIDLKDKWRNLTRY